MHNEPINQDQRIITEQFQSHYMHFCRSFYKTCRLLIKSIHVSRLLCLIHLYAYVGKQVLYLKVVSLRL